MKKINKELFLNLISDCQSLNFSTTLHSNLLKEFKIKNKIFYKVNGSDSLSVYHDLLNKRFLSGIPVSKVANAFVKEKSYLDFLEPHTFSYNFLRLDLSSFFHSINRSQVLSSLSHYIEDCYIDDSNKLSLLDAICNSVTYKVVEESKNTSVIGKTIVPIGLRTSPSISNIIFRKVDLLIERVCTKHNITYTRYADDLLFSSSRANSFVHSKRFVDEVAYILSLENFKLNRRKTVIAKHTISINGYVIENPSSLSEDLAKIKISNKKTKAIEKFLYHLNRGDSDKKVLTDLFKFKVDRKTFMFFPPSDDFLKTYCKQQVINKLQGFRSYLLSFHSFQIKTNSIDSLFLKKSSNLLKAIEKEINKRV